MTQLPVSKIDRRGFLVSMSSAAATLLLPAPAFAESPGLLLETHTSTGRTLFRVRLDNAVDIRAIQVFALGERKPLLAEFAPVGGVFPTMTGAVTLGRDQHLMALAHLADGGMIHTRSFVSATAG